MTVWSIFIWVMYVPVAGSCEHGSEPSDSIKGEKFVSLCYCQFLKKDSAPKN
jgi:hypothetical protein